MEQDWTAEEFTRGCYGGRLGAGAWTQYGKALAAPVGRIHWAGAETSDGLERLHGRRRSAPAAAPPTRSSRNPRDPRGGRLSKRRIRAWESARVPVWTEATTRRRALKLQRQQSRMAQPSPARHLPLPCRRATEIVRQGRGTSWPLPPSC